MMLAPFAYAIAAGSITLLCWLVTLALLLQLRNPLLKNTPKEGFIAGGIAVAIIGFCFFVGTMFQIAEGLALL